MKHTIEELGMKLPAPDMAPHLSLIVEVSLVDPPRLQHHSCMSLLDEDIAEVRSS